MKSGESICLFLNRFAPKVVKAAGRECARTYSETEYADAKQGLNLYGSFVDLKNKDILDAGCGLGGKTVYYAEQGCNSAIGIDMDENHIKYSWQFAKSKGCLNTQFRIADLSQLPFESNRFDVVFLDDVVEHIRRPVLTAALKECRRVIKSNGRICLSFPPWNSWDAAHLYDYIHIPWCQFLFSSETLVNVLRRMNPNPRFGQLSFIQHFQELNRITVSEFMEIISKLDFKVVHLDSYMIKNKKFLKHIPFLNKYFVSRFVAVLSK